VDCPNLDSLTIDRDRLIEAEWVVDEDSDSTYTVRISVYTVDKTGILADLSAVISANNINITHIDASTTYDKQAHFNFILEVKTKSQLADLIRKLSQLNGVL
jgi:GTP pyrophosphokinase